jgi:hypothetical protein
MSVPASTPVRVPGWRGTQVVSAVMAAACCSGMLTVARRYSRPCGADASDVVSVNEIGKREELTTNVCDEHT